LIIEEEIAGESPEQEDPVILPGDDLGFIYNSYRSLQVDTMVRLSPSILSANPYRLHQEVEKAIDAGIDMLHVDVMDGHFVPNITFGIPLVRWLRKETDLELDVHLMISDPDTYASRFAEAGADIVTVHVEATDHLDRTLQSIIDAGARPGVTLNPATPPETLDWVLEKAYLVLVMSVNPGFGGQSFIPSSLERIRIIRKMIEGKNTSTLIEVDGGISPDTIGPVVEAGADIAVAGSAIFSVNNRDIKGNIERLIKASAI
jgi:ribulose-phosphate 3-epimerase